MTDSSFPSGLKLCLALPILGLLMGANQANLSPEAQVGQRALGRWQAFIQGDFKKAYSYLSPGYRKVTSFPLYRAHIGSAVQWQAASLEAVACADKVCDVVVSIRYQYRAPPIGEYEGESRLKETWVQANNKWWFLPKE